MGTRPPVCVLCLFAALVVESAAAGALVLVYSLAFGASARLGESTATAASYVLLAVAGFGGGGLAVAGWCLALVSPRRTRVVVVATLLTVPATAVAVVAVYGLCVFLALM